MDLQCIVKRAPRGGRIDRKGVATRLQTDLMILLAGNFERVAFLSRNPGNGYGQFRAKLVLNQIAANLTKRTGWRWIDPKRIGGGRLLGRRRWLWCGCGCHYDWG